MDLTHYNAAINWAKANTLPGGGVCISSEQRSPYLEVTGYWIPTLLDAGEDALAQQYAEFLNFMQRPSGAFAGPDGREYIFDTLQVLRGLNRAAALWPQYQSAAIKAAEYVHSHVQESGRLPSIYKGDVPEHVHVFGLHALKEAGELYNRPEFIQSAQRATQFYKQSAVAEVFAPAKQPHTHFLAYVLDGFIEMGEGEFVRPHVEAAFARQHKNGSIPGVPGAKWVLSTGLAQLAICAFKLNMPAQALRALAYLSTQQNPETGGFVGSFGRGASYFPKAEIAWAPKFFADACAAYLQHYRSHLPLNETEHTPLHIAGAAQAEGTAPVSALCIGSQAFQKQVGAQLEAQLTGSVADIQYFTSAGAAYRLPFGVDSFHYVVAENVLETLPNYAAAITELCRVLKDGGGLTLVGATPASSEGNLPWAGAQAIRAAIASECTNIALNNATHNATVWQATKGADTLNSEEWHGAIIAGVDVPTLASKVRSNNYPVWVKPLLQHTSAGDTLLELGSGTGELSAILATYGRQVQLMDYSQDNITYTQALFKELNLTESATFMCADFFKPWPAKPASADWVFSSGVLEHYNDADIINILKASAAVARKGVLSLIPNANALLYRMGKFNMEQNGTWSYGREMPRHSLASCFKAAGLTNVQEYSVSEYHAANFKGVPKELAHNFFNGLTPTQRTQLNQGYLLFTYAEVAK